MRVVVREAFHDKFHFARIFNVGEVVDFVDERARDLISRGLAEKAHVNDVQEGDKPPKVKDAGGKTTVSGSSPAKSSEGANAETVSLDADAGNYAAGAKRKSEEAAAAKIAKVKAKMSK